MENNYKLINLVYLNWIFMKSVVFLDSIKFNLKLRMQTQVHPRWQEHFPFKYIFSWGFPQSFHLMLNYSPNNPITTRAFWNSGFMLQFTRKGHKSKGYIQQFLSQHHFLLSGFQQAFILERDPSNSVIRQFCWWLALSVGNMKPLNCMEGWVKKDPQKPQERLQS